MYFMERKKTRHGRAPTVKWLWVITSKLWLISYFHLRSLSAWREYHLKKEKKKTMWELPLYTSLLIHMKLMLFTDFLQTHQSNLHPSDRFPLLNFTKIFGGDANASNNHRVKTGLWDLIETQIIKNLSECSDKPACMWAFEWKVIQHRACHGSQRKTTTSYRLLQHKSCQSLL